MHFYLGVFLTKETPKFWIICSFTAIKLIFNYLSTSEFVDLSLLLATTGSPFVVESLFSSASLFKFIARGQMDNYSFFDMPHDFRLFWIFLISDIFSISMLVKCSMLSIWRAIFKTQNFQFMCVICQLIVEQWNSASLIRKTFAI